MKAKPMSHKLLTDARLFSLIDCFDADIAADAHASGCPTCAGPLDRADYPRKPRGGVAAAAAQPLRRPSSCCRVDGCRKRRTPPQLRFLGRCVYVSVVVVLVAAMCQGPKAQRVAALERALGISRRTIRRWSAWWREVFPTSDVWKGRRAQLVPPVADPKLPRALVDRLVAAAADAAAGMMALLQLVVA